MIGKPGSPEYKAWQAAYYREWRRRNAEHKKAKDHAYRQTASYKAKRRAKRQSPEFKEQFNEYARKRYAEREDVRAKDAEYYQANKDRWRAQAVERREIINQKRKERYQVPEKKAVILKRNNKNYHQRDKALRRIQWRTKREAELANLAGSPRPDICQVCSNTSEKIVFDHCHTHGHWRGWICQSCNKILGFAKDDANRLRLLITYLEQGLATSSSRDLPASLVTEQ